MLPLGMLGTLPLCSAAMPARPRLVAAAPTAVFPLLLLFPLPPEPGSPKRWSSCTRQGGETGGMV